MIQFKTDRIKSEYTSLEKENPKLHSIVFNAMCFVKQEFNKDLTITCIYRSPEENAALYAGAKEPAWKPHTLWCGVDVRSTVFTKTEIAKLLSFLNHFTVWGGQRKCAAYHAIAGNVEHFHIQAERAPSHG